MKSIDNCLTVSIAKPKLLDFVPAEFVFLQSMADLVGRLAVKGNFQGTMLHVIRNGESVSVGLCYRLLGFSFRFRNSCGSFSFCNSHFLSCNGLLVVLYCLDSRLIKYLHNAVQIFHSLAHLLLQSIGLLRAVMADGIVIITEIIYKLF